MHVYKELIKYFVTGKLDASTFERFQNELYIPKCAVYESTRACNLKCEHCGSTAEKELKDELKTYEAVQLMKDLKNIRCEGVALTGGEPLLRKDWYVIADAIKDNEMELSIISNGLLVEKNLEKIVELQPSVVGISIDGAVSQTHDKIRGMKGSFDKAIGAVYQLKEKGVPVSIITSLSKRNVYELDGIKNLIVDRGINWQVQMVTCNGQRFSKDLMLSKDEFYQVGLKLAKFREQGVPVIGAHDMGYHSCNIPVLSNYQWIGCQAGITNIGIQSNGNIKGCLALPDSFIEGNIRKKSLEDIWKDPTTFKVNRHFNIEDLGEYCNDCEEAVVCQGGCSDVSHSLTGEVHNNPYCFNSIEKEKNKEVKKE